MIISTKYPEDFIVVSRGKHLNVFYLKNITWIKLLWNKFFRYYTSCMEFDRCRYKWQTWSCDINIRLNRFFTLLHLTHYSAVWKISILRGFILRTATIKTIFIGRGENWQLYHLITLNRFCYSFIRKLFLKWFIFFF